MILEVRSLRLVLAIAEHGTLTRAAHHLDLTQSALSHQLLQLEGRLRLHLFHRMGRRMIATRAGERLVDAARRVLPELVRAEEDLQSEAAGRTAIIRLSTECFTGYHWLPGILAPFRAAYPGVEVQIVADATADPLTALLESRLDLAIVHSPPLHPRVRYFPLFVDEMVLVTPPAHSLAGRAWVTPADLQPEHLIMYALPADMASVVRTFLAADGVTPHRVSYIQLTEAIVEMVKAGLGVAALTRWAVQPHLEAGTLRAVRLGRGGLRREWRAAVLQEKPPRHLQQFIRLVARGPKALGEAAASA